LRLSDIAARLDCTLEGDATIDIARVASIEDAGPGDLTFVANAKYQTHLATTRASAVIVSQAQPIDSARGLAVLRSRHPYLSFAQALHLMATTTRPTPGVDRLAAVAADATLAPACPSAPSS
jgi:UDP-3-O-[3-hydroxymyristoyl] glucosamine N-acyltransferase